MIIFESACTKTISIITYAEGLSADIALNCNDLNGHIELGWPSTNSNENKIHLTSVHSKCLSIKLMLTKTILNIILMIIRYIKTIRLVDITSEQDRFNSQETWEAVAMIAWAHG